MPTDEQANRMIAEHPMEVAAYATVSASVVRALKVELHRAGQHAAAAMLATFIGDLEMCELSAIELVARSMLDASDQRTPGQRRAAIDLNATKGPPN